MDTAERIHNKLPIKNIRKAVPTMGAILVSYDRDPSETKSAGGIILPQKQDLFLVTATVVRTSKIFLPQSMTELDSPVEVGQKILIERRAGMILGEQEDGLFYKVINPKDIILILHEDNEDDK
jgi:co-chaperonin GroES (HSP10)